MFDRMDKDKNGMLTRAEFDAAKAGGRDLVYIDSEIGLTAEVPVTAEPLAERR